MLYTRTLGSEPHPAHPVRRRGSGRQGDSPERQSANENLLIAPLHRSVRAVLWIFGLRRVRRLVDVALNVGEEIGDRNPQTSCDREGRLDGEIVFSALDAAHVGPVEPAMIRKGFLRKPLFSTKFTDAVPQNDL